MPLQYFHPSVGRWFTERLAAFLWAIDGLLRQGESLPDETQMLYVSPLKARGLKLSAADPLNLEVILTPEPRVPSQARPRVLVA